MEEEDEARGDQGHEEVAEIGEGGGRYGADDQVADETTTEGGDLGENGDAEDVEVLADGEECAGDGEDEDADEVEGVLDGGGEQVVEHRAIVQVPEDHVGTREAPLP